MNVWDEQTVVQSGVHRFDDVDFLPAPGPDDGRAFAGNVGGPLDASEATVTVGHRVLVHPHGEISRGVGQPYTSLQKAIMEGRAAGYVGCNDARVLFNTSVLDVLRMWDTKRRDFAPVVHDSGVLVTAEEIDVAARTRGIVVAFESSGVAIILTCLEEV